MADGVIDIEVPDIGDFDTVDVIEVLVSPGDTVAVDDPLITLESDKASMEVPSPRAGKIVEIQVAAGDQVSAGTVIATLEASDGEGAEEEGADAEDAEAESAEGRESGEGAKADEQEDKAPKKRPESAPQKKTDGKKTAGKKASAESSTEEKATASAPKASPEAPPPAPNDQKDAADLHAELLVLGSGPGGYTAAFRAADLGLQVTLVERYDTLGGVCLNVGCIPSKALLHAGKVIEDAAAMAEHGVRFGEPEIDLDALRSWKGSVVSQLTGGLDGLAEKRQVRVVQGEGRFVASHTLEVEGEDGTRKISFDQAIVAAGSRVIEIPGIPWEDPRVMDSTGALELAEVPERLLVIGGGIIGLEMGCVYGALGSKVTVVEMLDQLMPGADKALVRPFQKHVAKRWEAIHLSTKVAKVEAADDGLVAHFEAAKDGGEAPEPATFDRVLVAVGRRPNGDRIGAEAAGLEVTERGFLPVDRHQRTKVSHIFAIGDIVGGPMLAHKASHEGKVAAEVAAGEPSAFDARGIPSVAYTDPEVAWVGLTEEQAKADGTPYGKGTFPWAASGRALGLGRPEGTTQLLFDPDTGRLLGAGMVGPGAGDLIAEAVLALEMGADAEDLALTIHPHPTLSETVAFAAEMYEGTITDLYAPKKGSKQKSSKKQDR